MARIFITGSADGLGHMAAKLLVDQGHKVVLYALNAERGKEALRTFKLDLPILILHSLTVPNNFTILANTYEKNS